MAVTGACVASVMNPTGGKESNSSRSSKENRPELPISPQFMTSKLQRRHDQVIQNKHATGMLTVIIATSTVLLQENKGRHALVRLSTWSPYPRFKNRLLGEGEEGEKN